MGATRSKKTTPRKRKRSVLTKKKKSIAKKKSRMKKKVMAKKKSKVKKKARTKKKAKVKKKSKVKKKVTAKKKAKVKKKPIAKKKTGKPKRQPTQQKINLKLTNRQVKKFLEEIIGKNAMLVLKSCEKGLTDEGIQKETELKIPIIRSLLNQLHYSGLVRYDREKDQYTNWYTYTWFAQKDKIAEIIRNGWQDKLKELEKKYVYESSYVFFVCSNGCERMPFELAAEYDFRCPECGSQLESDKGKKHVKEVLNEIKELNELIESIGR